MNSPGDSSSSDSGTPPPEVEESRFEPSYGEVNIPSPSKRRTPYSSDRSVPFSRDSKARRRDDYGRQRMMHVGGGSPWDAPREPPSRNKDELVDQQIAEQLRAQFGDPFDDSTLKSSK
ncbi:hypothetical protein IEO21_04229 [Rhodonia placenta]|uniref:Uncharacterized protein n=1 Tax=Rhodonia placenta TaxID=104341 RepID=A0A8H7P490_9APHY|nr:hypothetical protein IEO21_04229 [Postia placenta]